MKTISKLILGTFLIIAISCKGNTEKEVATIQVLKTEDISKTHYIQVALLLDTSNSMDGLIDQAKAQLWEIVNELSYAKHQKNRPTLQIALYEYGNDNLSSTDGYVRKILEFTSDLDEVSKELFSLTTRGGSEYCGTVIKASLDKLNWQKNADNLKMIFIAGNEPFTQGNIHYKDAAIDAKEKNVIVNTIFCGNYEQGIQSNWQDGANLTYGDYMAIDHNQKTVYVASPYDDIIIQLNIKLNETYIPYGGRGKDKVAMQSEQDLNAETYSKANAVSRAVSKSSHLYKNESWDLVDAEKETDFNYSELKKSDLPGNLKGKSEVEIKKYVALKSAEREKVQKEIANLNEKRKQYLSEQTTAESNGLENAMLTSIKKQAEKKNYNWEK